MNGVPEALRPTTFKGWAAAALAAVIGAFLVIGMSATLYQRVLPPMERARVVSTEAPAFPEAPAVHAEPEPGGWYEYSDNTNCRIGSPTFQTCIDADHRQAEVKYQQAHREWVKAEAGYQREFADWEAKMATIQAQLVADNAPQGSFIKRLTARWQFWVGGLLLLGSIALVAMSKDPEVPPHRDPDGPAAAVLRTEHSLRYTPIFFAMAASIPLLCSLHSFTGFLVGGAAAVVFAGSVVVMKREETARLAGFRLADAQWQAAVHAAELAGQAPPPEPHITEAEALLSGATGGYTPEPGSAQEVMLDAAGKLGPSVAAWNRVATAVGLGAADERGTFRPWAWIEGGERLEGGDCQLRFALAVGKTAADLTKIAPALVRELRVRRLIDGAFTTDHTTGLAVGVFSNRTDDVPSQTSRAASAGPPPVDDDWNF